LNPLEPAPIDDVNDPPPTSALPQDYNFERIWAINGQQVLFSGGPDVLVGNPQSAWNPDDEFPFLSTCIRAVKTTQGLIVFTSGSIEIILGGPQTASFYSVTLAPGIGLGNFNALDIYAGELFFLDTTSTLKVLSPTLSISNAGFPIADQLQLLNPKTAYVAFHDGPNDQGLYIGTGTSTYNGATGWFRMTPRQIPGGLNGPEPVWSPFAAITQGCQLLQSVEISAGVKKLLVGSTSANQEIGMRNTSVFTDLGTAYDANVQWGALWLCRRGELAICRFIECDFASVTTNPTVSFLLNDITGGYTNFVNGSLGVPQLDPPNLYGTTGAGPDGYNPYRYYFTATGSLAKAVHMNVGVDFGTTSNADELFTFTVYGGVIKGR
jgi:hypothetical protein